MRTRLLRGSIVAVASIVLITATLSAGAGPGVSFAGSSAHGGYGLFVRLQCSGGCTGTGSGAVAVVQLTAGRPPAEKGPCPWGADQLMNAPLVDGRFATGEWLFIAPKTFAWLWVSGDLVSATQLVGRIQGPPACGGRDGYTLRAGSAASG